MDLGDESSDGSIILSAWIERHKDDKIIKISLVKSSMTLQRGSHQDPNSNMIHMDTAKYITDVVTRQSEMFIQLLMNKNWLKIKL